MTETSAVSLEKRSAERAVAFVLLVVVFLVGLAVWSVAARPAHGEDGGNPNLSTSNSSGYKIDRQTVAWRTGVAVADVQSESTSVVGTTSTTSFVLNGFQTIQVSCRCSSSGAVVKLRVVYMGLADIPAGGRIKDVSVEKTATADLFQDKDGKWVAPSVPFDGLGARYVRVYVTSISAGTVDLWVGSE